jgi:hypothetical protein
MARHAYPRIRARGLSRFTRVTCDEETVPEQVAMHPHFLRREDDVQWLPEIPTHLRGGGRSS